MRVLVTGHLGYIGCVLTPMLTERGHDVHGIDSDMYRNCTFFGSVPDVPATIKDVRDVYPEELKGYDAVIHLAGLSNDPLGDYRPELTEDINFRGSVRMAQMAKSAGVERFIFASSCSNYGASGDNFLTEKAAFNPVTPYGESKVNVEHSVGPMASDEFSPVFLRASTAYGVSPRLRFDLVVNNLVAWAFTTGKVHIKSDGTPWRPLVHVEDIARAYVAALEAPRDAVHGQAFNVGQTSENYRIREVADLVERQVPNCEIEFAADGGPDKRCYRVDCNYISRTLHEFKPQWTVARGIQQLYERYVDVGLKLEDFEGVRFQRIAHVKHLLEQKHLDDNLRWVA
ncbi:MAG: NAD-dependent epimerase/dehydratase family protein [Pseudomonadales bacterium]